MTLLEGTQLGPYQILSPLGKGGMGEVYRAEDTRLGREVAIKVLPQRLADDDLALTRFEREAKAVAALSHPNILAIYDVGRENETYYVVMELLEGETLRERLQRSPLPWRQAIEVGIGIADGLAAAHAKGVIHRDLKPENIFLTRAGVVKILDFGLARIESPTCELASSDSPTMTLDTRPGTVVGTINYMSPEQVRGRPTDMRSDVFSFGCVMYEMVTGQRAFGGATSADTITAILKEEPPGVASSMSDVSPDLDRLISRCLGKLPDQRFHAAADLAFTLRTMLGGSGSRAVADPLPRPRMGRLAGAVGILATLVLAAWLLWPELASRRPLDAANIRSLAVLPFENLSRNPDQDIFVDSMSEAITDDLAKISALQVIAARTMREYKDTDQTLPQIAKRVRVDAFVTGSALQVADRIEFRVRLVDAGTERQLWSNRYQGPRSDILAIQQRVARAVADEIQVQLTPSEQQLLRGAPRVHPAAYDAYVRGRELERRGTRESCLTALNFFDQAIELDPRFALAYAGKARTYETLASTHMHPRDTLPAMKEAANRALELDGNLAEAHVAIGSYLMQYEWAWERAGQSFRRALDLNPNLATARLAYANYLTCMKKTDEALTQLDMARELDPAIPYTEDMAGAATFGARRYDLTIRDSREALQVDPEYWPAHQWMGLAQSQLGQFADAAFHLETAARLSQSPMVRAMLGSVLALSGKRAEAKALRSELRKLPSDMYVCPYEVATISIALGELDEAFEDMHQACDDRAQCIPFLQADPRLDDIRDDPRFDELLTRVGFEPPKRQLQLADRNAETKPTLAVLPLIDYSVDRTDWFADSLTEELIGTLAKINGLNVISQQSIIRFKNSKEGLVSIARKLGANFILRGSTFRADDRWRINVNLIDGGTDKHLWSDRYENAASDVLTLQNDVARAVAEQIQITLTPQDHAQLGGARTVNVEAYEAYLRGREYLRHQKAEDALKSLEWFDQAIDIDPSFALAYVGKSEASLFLVADYGAPHEWMPKAKVAALKAIELDGSLAEAHAALGLVQLEYDWQWNEAVGSIRRALELKPGLPEAHLAMAEYYTIMNDAAQAEKHLSVARESDPYSIASSEMYGLTYYLTRQYEKLVDHCREAIAIDPTYYHAYEKLGWGLAKLGDFDGAIDAAKEAVRLYPNPVTKASLGSVYATAGRKREARQILRELEHMREERYICSYRSAVIHSEIDETEQAFDMLGRACEEKSECMPFINVDPRLDPLRTDLRFGSFVECVGLEPEPLPITLHDRPEQ